ncbi:MAG: hypothetical protein WA390_08745, partial [Nitrososphaeraceae archaeon]
PTNTNKINAIQIAADIGSIEEVFDSQCLDFVIKFVLAAGTSNKMLNFVPPIWFCSWSYIVYG